MLVLQIALGIVLGVLIVMNFGLVLVLLGWLIVGVIGLAVVLGIVWLFAEYLAVALILTLVLAGAALVVWVDSKDSGLAKERERRKHMGYSD